MAKAPGMLMKALSEVSAYAARKTDLWPDLMDRLEGCMLPTDIDAFELHVVSLGLQVPANWHENIEDAVERRRAEIDAENITQIMRDRFDF